MNYCQNIMNRVVVLGVAVSLVFTTAIGYAKTPAAPKATTRPTVNVLPPTYANMAYGEHPRQVLDFWAAPGNSPRPLLIYIHGGGWGGGDKVPCNEAKPWVAKGVSVASINYRLTSDAPLPAPVHDAARALQFLRYKASELNIDPTRVALTGGSAGACTSLWILFHDDLADPNSPDPIARQSTRVRGALVLGAQTSIDPVSLNEWIGERAASFGMIYCSVGAKSYKDMMANYEKYKPLLTEFSPINHLDANDPPVMFYYRGTMALPPANWNEAIHHPMFGMKFKEKADKIGYTKYSIQYGKEYFGKRMSMAAFIESLLLDKAPDSDGAKGDARKPQPTDMDDTR